MHSHPPRESQPRESKANSSLSIIVLAAGLSRRMGATNKLLHPITIDTVSKPMLAHVLCNLQKIDTDLCDLDYRIVLGHESERVTKLLFAFPQFHAVFNASYANGLTSSIQCAVQSAPPHTQATMLCLADMPWIATSDYQTMIEIFVSANCQQLSPQPNPQLNIKPNIKPNILRPTVAGKPGHPVIFSCHFQKEILAHENPHGCQEIVQRNHRYLSLIPFDSTAMLRDVDTKSDLDEASSN